MGFVAVGQRRLETMFLVPVCGTLVASYSYLEFVVPTYVLLLSLLPGILTQARFVEVDGRGITLHSWLSMRRIAWGQLDSIELLVEIGATLSLRDEDGWALARIDCSTAAARLLARRLGEHLIDDTTTAHERPPLYPAHRALPSKLILHDDGTCELGAQRCSLSQLSLTSADYREHWRELVCALAAARPNSTVHRWTSPRRSILVAGGAALCLQLVLWLLSCGLPLHLLLGAPTLYGLYLLSTQEHLVAVGANAIALRSFLRGQRVVPWHRVGSITCCRGPEWALMMLDRAPVIVQLPSPGFEALRVLLATGGVERFRARKDLSVRLVSAV